MNETRAQNTPQQDEVYLVDYLIMLARNGRLIIGVTVAATVLTYLILFIGPNRYTAMARILPPQQNMTLSANWWTAWGIE